jgi:hypothetical protein
MNLLKNHLEKSLKLKPIELSPRAALFLETVKGVPASHPIFDLETESVYCFVLELVQPGLSFCYRMKERALQLATYLASNSLSLKSIDSSMKMIKELKVSYPDSELEDWLKNHQLSILNFLKTNPPLLQKIGRISYPLANLVAEEIVKETVGSLLKSSDQEIAAAILSSAFYPLRQTVGSCFATAVSIVIQREHPGWFFEECINLISTGKIKRVLDGVEFTVPLNPSIEVDQNQQLVESEEFKKALSHFSLPQIKYFSLRAPRLLKAFEYTVASMTEFGIDTHKGTVGLSLGIDPKHANGLGAVIQTILEQELRVLSNEIEKIEVDAQTALDQVNITNSQLSQAYDPEKIQRLKASGYSFEYHLRATLEKRDGLVEESKTISGFLQKWIDLFSLHLNRYFQEIFDPNLVEHQEFWQDSPAGFRLIFKHGRQDPKAWTFIEDENGYKAALKEFFISFEHFLNQEYESRRLKALIGLVTVDCLRFIHSESFVKNALQRLKTAATTYQFVQPWCYLSGGTLKSVISCFTGKISPLKEIHIHPKNASELFLFLIEFMKECPSRIQDEFLKSPEKGFLMQSPTHAFILRPGLKPFSNFWMDTGFSYTALRDEFFKPIQKFYRNKILSIDEQHRLFELIERDRRINIPRVDVNPLDIPSFIEKTAAFTKLSKDKISVVLHQFFHRTTVQFADTNWPYFWFSFVVNPLSCDIELWRESFDKRVFSKMTEWGDTFSNGNGHWIIYMEALTEYNFSSMEWLKLYPKA